MEEKKGFLDRRSKDFSADVTKFIKFTASLTCPAGRTLVLDANPLHFNEYHKILNLNKYLNL